MKLTDYEQRMLDGEFGEVKAQALDYLVQFGDAFGAEKLVDITYVHYPAEMSIYKGQVEDVVEYSKNGEQVCVPTTTSTLACDLDQWEKAGCPKALYDLQEQVVDAYNKMGVLCTFTCTPQFLGFIPPKNSYIVSVESSAIIYFNSVLGARTNRGGFLTRYSAITGKYPLMGYLLDENRKGTHLFNINLKAEDLKNDVDYSALGFYVGDLVGSEVPVFSYLGNPTQDSMLSLGAALATSGSVTLFHAPPHTAEASTIEEAFQGTRPKETHEVTLKNLKSAFDKLTNIGINDEIDFVTLGCPHYNLEKLRLVAKWIKENNAIFNPDVTVWICTNRFTKQAGLTEGVVQVIEKAGASVVCDGCPVESHMRISTCKDFNMPTPQIQAMVTDSCKMARYVGDLIGCKTALIDFENCLKSAVSGKFVK